MIIASTTDEEERSKELEKTATILSSSRLAGTYGVGIKAVTCITAGQGEIERGEGQKKGGRQMRRRDEMERREEMEEMRLKEKTLLREAFESLDIFH